MPKLADYQWVVDALVAELGPENVRIEVDNYGFDLAVVVIAGPERPNIATAFVLERHDRDGTHFSLNDRIGGDPLVRSEVLRGVLDSAIRQTRGFGA